MSEFRKGATYGEIKTYYEREEALGSEPHSSGSRNVVAYSHLPDVPPSEHYAVYAWRCECGHLMISEHQSTGCIPNRCNW